MTSSAWEPRPARDGSGRPRRSWFNSEITEERPRLLLATPDFPPKRGGIQLLLGRLVERLKDFETLVVTRGPRTLRPLSNPSGLWPRVRRGRPEVGKASLLVLNCRILGAGLRFRPDLVLCAHVITAPACVAVAAALRVPLVSYVYADELPAQPLLARWALRTSARTIAISGYAQELALAHGAPVGTVRLVAPGVDAPHTPAIDHGTEDRPTLITVARLTDHYKGHDLVLRALRAVRVRVPRVQWLVVGDGPLRAELEASARALGVDDCVSFLGAPPDVERDRLLARSHVFVMPSRLPPGGAGGEGFGIVYLEAGLHGVPSVAGAVAGAGDAVLHDRTGLLVEPTDEGAIADAISELLVDVDRSRHLGRAAVLHARRFTWDRMTREVEDVLREALRA